MNNFFIYVLRSLKTGKMYTGHTNNLERRLFEHNSGLEKSTKFGSPWKLIYQEKFSTRGEAMKREKELKTGKGREFLAKFKLG
jgi:putative endonuclease